MSEAYFYLGHGSDFCDREKKPVIKTVPPGSVYISATVCGIVNRLKSEKLLTEAFMNKNNEALLRNPTPEGLQKVFKDLMDVSTLHIHKPGDTYVENEYYPISHHKLGYKNKWITRTNWYDNAKAQYYYLNPSGIYRLSDVLKLKPENIPKNKIISKTTFLNASGKEITSFKISKEDVLSSLEYAIYPKLTTPDKKKFSFFTDKDMDYITNKYKKKASYLLESYPGVHYNFLCRVVKPECQRSALVRRMESAEKFETLPATFEKTLKENRNQTVSNFFKTAFLDKQRPVKMLTDYYYKLPPSIKTEGSVRSALEKQLFDAAKTEIQYLFRPEEPNFSIVEKILNHISETSLYERIGEIETLCRTEAKKSNGKKDALLQDCLQYLEKKKIGVLGSHIMFIFESMDQTDLETKLQYVDTFLKGISKETLEKYKNDIFETIELDLLDTNNNERRQFFLNNKDSIVKRTYDLLKQYGIQKSSGGKRKTRKQNQNTKNKTISNRK